MSNALFHRLLHRKPAPPTTRMNVCPPDIVPRRESLWTAALRWLVGGDAQVAPALRTPLERARSEFVAALEGLAEVDPNGLLQRAQHARSLRELWHLRAEVFSVVSCHASQQEARARLTRLNRHFPARAPRSGFGGFDATPQAPVRD